MMRVERGDGGSVQTATASAPVICAQDSFQTELAPLGLATLTLTGESWGA